ncbi:MAG TPA: ATP-binding protein, partial [Roseiflexaceae bacterium]|nr:ATP-binding protein [Roseiflexaceae bacterium]
DAKPALTALEPIDLGELLPAIVAQVEPLAAERQQRIALGRLPALCVRGNEDDLIRLFLNLLDNAIRYTPQGGQISVVATVAGMERGGEGLSRRKAGALSTTQPLASSPAHPVAIISIHDTGPGVAPEHLPHLFDRFFRADRGRSRAQGGSGLGLAIAQSIARAHGGRLEVTSVVGQGSTFTAILPCAVDHLQVA